MRISRVIAGSAALVAVLSDFGSAQSVDRARPYDYPQPSADAPGVDLWLDRLDFNFGDPIRPYFASEPGAFVTVVRVSTDGEMKVLYPRRPSEQRSLPTGSLANDRVPYGDDRAFRLYESSGTGFVFAIASFERFDFRYYTSGAQWSISRLAILGNADPFATVNQFISRTLSNRSNFSLDYMSYEVRGSSHGRSRYASNYLFYTSGDYYDRCLSSFRRRASYYCDNYSGYYDGFYGRLNGPVIVVRPQTPASPSSPTPRVGLRPRPLTPDPIVPRSPLPPAAEGTLTSGDAGREEAMMRAAARREAELRRERPSIRSAPRDENQPAPRAEAPSRIDREPRPEPRSQPRYEPPMQTRAEPRVESRPEPRVERPQPQVERHTEPREQSRPQPQPERRSEPRVESRPAPAARSEPSPPPPRD